jgi:hypothetical protein
VEKNNKYLAVTQNMVKMPHRARYKDNLRRLNKAVAVQSVSSPYCATFMLKMVTAVYARILVQLQTKA